MEQLVSFRSRNLDRIVGFRGLLRGRSERDASFGRVERERVFLRKSRKGTTTPRRTLMSFATPSTHASLPSTAPTKTPPDPAVPATSSSRSHPPPASPALPPSARIPVPCACAGSTASASTRTPRQLSTHNQKQKSVPRHHKPTSHPSSQPAPRAAPRAQIGRAHV